MKTIKVLLADDHAVVRAGIRQFLERAEDIQVVAEADDGEIAKSLIEKHQPDVAVLDIQMPNTSGIDLTRWLRAKNLEIAVLILTAYDDDPYVVAVLQAGANGYVLKTADPDEIIQAVRDVSAGKAVLAPDIAEKVILKTSSLENEIAIEALTRREEEVLTLVGKGQTNKAIAAELGISDRTVQGHLANIFTKMQVASRTEAVMRAVSLGLISVEI
jgi:DNA-binding NarL/FixJ family response regulator